MSPRYDPAARADDLVLAISFSRRVPSIASARDPQIVATHAIRLFDPENS